MVNFTQKMDKIDKKIIDIIKIRCIDCIFDLIQLITQKFSILFPRVIKNCPIELKNGQILIETSLI